MKEKEEENNIDKLFQEKINKIQSIPKEINWNKMQGWREYDYKYHTKSMKLNLKLLTALAAACVILFSIGIFIYLQTHSYEKSFTDVAGKTIRELRISGYHCFLAQNCKMQFGKARSKYGNDTLMIEGEAYIETSGEKKLVIIAKNTVTKCEKAVVNINAPKFGQTTIISVVSGNVISRCTDNDFPEMKIDSTEEYTVYEGGLFAAKEPNDDPNFLAWKTGTLIFDNTPLAYAIKSIEEYYGVKIEVKSPSVKYCRLTSRFNNMDLSKVMDNLQLSFGTKIKRTNSEFVIEGGSCD